MEYGYRPENPAPEGTRDAAPATKVTGLDAQNVKDKFTGNIRPAAYIRWSRRAKGVAGKLTLFVLRQEAYWLRIAYRQGRAFPGRPRYREAVHARRRNEVVEG